MNSCAPEIDPEAPLHQLIGAGYRFVHPRDAAGDVVAVVGVRAHGNVVDVVRIDDVDDVTATRVPGDEQDVLDPADALWQETGRVDEVVSSLLTLADDYRGTDLDTPAEPVKGCWVPAGEGRSAFLLAS